MTFEWITNESHQPAAQTTGHGLARRLRSGLVRKRPMPSFEYSEFDGSQEFQPLSADSLFDRVAEFLLEHGDQALRHLEDLDRDDADLLKLLIKEGYLEKDDQ